MRPLQAGLIGLLFALALTAPARGQALGVDVISPTGRWVTDQADLLSTADERRLARTLAGYADTTSTQIVVVTLKDLGGEPIARYAFALGRVWGVGQEQKDNGVVILVSEGDREVFIATGYGLGGAIPDAIAARIVRNIIRPAFREGQFYAGLAGATDALIAAAAGEFEATAAAQSPDDGGTGAALLYILGIFGFFVVSGLRKRRRHGDGTKSGVRRDHHGGRGGVFPIIFWGGGFDGGDTGGGGFGGGGFGGFGGGGGGFGGGGAGGGW